MGAIGSIEGDDITSQTPQHMHPPFNTAGDRHFNNEHSVITGEYLKGRNLPRMRPSRESVSLLCTPPDIASVHPSLVNPHGSNPVLTIMASTSMQFA